MISILLHLIKFQQIYVNFVVSKSTLEVFREMICITLLSSFVILFKGADSEVESYKKLTTIHQSECREVTPICAQPIDFGQIEQRQSDGSTFSNECTFKQSRILRSAESVLEIVNFDERMKNSLKTRKPRRSPVGGKWSQEEDLTLLRLVGKYGPKNWKLIAQELGGIRDKVQCLHRYNKVLKPGIQKGSWTEVEDAILLDAVRTYRNAPRIKWCEVAKNLHGRIGKQCRERWNNHVNPDIKKTSWSSEEDDMLFRSQLVFGNRWSEISKLLPGRTENNVKNRFHSKARQRWLNESRNNEYRKLPKTTVVKDPDPGAICELYQLSVSACHIIVIGIYLFLTLFNLGKIRCDA